MGSYENFVRKALDGIGGVSNIRHVSRCTRSIRIDYKHKKEIKEEVLKALPDCAGYVNRNHQVQLIIGKEAEAAYADFLSVSGWDPDHEPADTEPPEPDEYGPHNVRYYVNQFGNFVAPIFMPIIPALIVGGLILAVRNLLVNYFGVSMDSGAANLMTAIFQAGFTALPVYIGWTTCMKLKLSPILGMMLGYLMIGTTDTSGLITDIFGITVPQVNYGSSIMPQKKNPDICELVRGKVGRVYGDLMSLLTAMKGLPLAYNKDMQEDKEPAFDAIDTALACIPLFAGMLSSMKFNKDVMEKSAMRGFTNATDAADYLVGKGVPFRDAHGIIGRLVLHCIDAGKGIEELTLKELQEFSDRFGEDVFEAISLRACVNRRLTTGAPGEAAMKEEIAACRAWLQIRA